MKNDHFQRLCQEGQLGHPPLSGEKVSVAKNEHFLKLCQEQASFHIVASMQGPRVGWRDIF